MPYSPGQAAFKSAFEISPIVLSGGVASGLIGSMMSVMSVVQSLAMNDAGDFELDNSFAFFRPLPGSTLIEYQSGKYPFANLAVAANCVVKQPLTLSMLMVCPSKLAGDYWARTSLLTALRNTLDNHIASGGTFGVATPAFYYSGLLLLRLHDVTAGETHQAQIEFRWDFEKPLISLADAGAVQSQMMSMISSGLPTDGALSGTNAVSSSAGASPTAYAANVSSPAAGAASYSMISGSAGILPSGSFL